VHGQTRTQISSVFVCAGSDCAKSGCRSLIGELRLLGLEVDKVGCQKICEGPVAGVGDGSDLVWFESVDSNKARAGLASLAQGDPMAKALLKRRVKSRNGKRRS
jgi:hypothetical protein